MNDSVKATVAALVVLVAWPLLLATVALARLPDQAAVSVTVSDGTFGSPVEAATVTITPLSSAGATRARFRCVSNDGGACDIDAVPPGRYQVHVSKPGYVPGALGLQAPWDAGERSVDLGGGDRRSIALKIWQFGSIAGSITDAHGEAVPDATMVLLTRSEAGWSRAGRGVTSDDRGRFRAASLMPGDYIVGFQTTNIAGEKTATVFYPYVRDLSAAAVVRVESGRPGGDIVFAPGPGQEPALLSLDGRLLGSREAAQVHLIPAGADGIAASLQERTATTTSDGVFRFSEVFPGSYRVEAWSFPSVAGDVPRLNSAIDTGAVLLGAAIGSPISALPSAPTLFGGTSIDLRADVHGVAIQMIAASRITGRVVFKGAAPPPAADQLSTVPVIVRPADARDLGAIPQSRIESDGTFASVGLPPGRYCVAVSPFLASAALSRWHLESVRDGARELVGRALPLSGTDLSLVLTLTDRGTTLTGHVTDKTGRTAVGEHVLLFPADQAMWDFVPPFPAPRSFTETVTDDQGMFQASVIPGTYRVVAVNSVPQVWMRQEFLKTLLSGSVTLTIMSGETKTCGLVSITR